ncbi:biotin-dependent carboxyltransferase family protein [Pontibacillus sp. HMF3514]|uniref:5-oxoprolinase subunit C family protein n=1 Tax=Pontibacillus sp. HMF3514 TaxID=2692425 RepID=UPI00131F826F|nr:biotin-dependent carboxyltransferase family protein [Pontibacillus sp. HMF3514]QHE53624.1 5-oxoprolinase/urea amidolyase family protein [Pontibacillus sp. HMF3514]
MSIPIFSVKKAGVYTSFQDKGRYGFQSKGVPVSGAMDRYASVIANHLVQNDEGEACLEVTFGGTELIAEKDHLIVICGADLDAKLNGEAAPLWKTVVIRKGDTLKFGGPKNGTRAYIAVQGGFNAPSYLGSYSVYERGGLGESVAKSDSLYVKQESYNSVNRGIVERYLPSYEKEIEIGVIPSHHQDLFEENSYAAFFETEYQVAGGDRMGIQLKNDNKLRFKDRGDILSEPTTFGTVQVPSSGDPIILMADSQTTGGYATIGTVVTADLWKVAQLPPGGKVSFKEVGLDEAVERHKEQQELLKWI